MASPVPQDMVDRAGDGRRRDRRAVQRYAVPLSGRWIADGRWVHTVIESMSHRGAALSCLVSLRVGEAGILKLDDLDVPIPGDVRWAHDGLAGVAFTLGEIDSERLREHIARHGTRGCLELPPGVVPASGV
ncbi:PilZ domain-containing protein [Roseospira marina]|nr:PilZ domain-containing protein [Roseospira marina]MBB4315694.1 hypothetical protein [Roseospira marina]MBB5088806.1 hypothetical protein [Roseospira marina]